MLQKRVPVEVGLLRLFYSLIQRVDESSLAECWPLLLSLLKEGLQINLTPPAIFLLLAYELNLLCILILQCLFIICSEYSELLLLVYAVCLLPW